MPLVADGRVSVQTSGSQPILVFADDGRSMGLWSMNHRHLETAPHRGRRLPGGHSRSAVIKGQATEVIDVGHFLPMAFADWFRPQGDAAFGGRASVLLVDDPRSYRNMWRRFYRRGLRGYGLRPTRRRA